MGWVKIARVDDVSVGDMIQVIVDDEPIALYRLEEGFRATSDICTHAGESLTQGTLQDCIIACPKHGGKFNVLTGEAIALPCVIPVEVYPVEVRDGEVWLDY